MPWATLTPAVANVQMCMLLHCRHPVEVCVRFQK
jgi:hypothetical protein